MSAQPQLEDRAREAFVDGILKRKGYTIDRIARALVNTRAGRLDQVPENLHFGAQRTYKGRTVNISSLAPDANDAAWLTNFLDGGTDPVEPDDEDGGSVAVPEDQGEGETPDAEPEPEPEEEELADDGPMLRQAFARMPASLMTKQDGVMLPDWSRILAGIRGVSKRQLEQRCLVAEKRFRDRMTRDAVIRQATAGIRGRNAAKLKADKHHVIWAAWRWLDRPENQQKIADVIRQARDTKPEPPARKPVAIKAPTPKDAAGVMVAKETQRRLREKAEKIIQGAGAASIMVADLSDCNRLGPGWHRLPGVITVTRGVCDPIPPPTDEPIVTTAVRTLVRICKGPVTPTTTRLRHLAVKVLK